MKTKTPLLNLRLFRIGAGLLLAFPLWAADPLLVVPLKPDPPFTIDGDLADWDSVPNQFVLDDRAHCTYSPDVWKNADDLSARGRMAWRAGALYLGVEVNDDASSTTTGLEMWKGDHIILYLDLTPGHEPDRMALGTGQWQFGFSPGTLKHTGDPLTDTKPEAVFFHPEGHSVQGIQVAAKRTPKGYTLEAAIPFELIGLANVAEGRDFNGELAISDSDAAEPKQEKMLTLSTDRWQPNRTRLRPMVFGNAAGKGELPARAVKLRESIVIRAGQSETISFPAPPVPDGKDGYVFLQARIAHSKVAGYSTGALRMALNGRQLDGARFTNRPHTSKTMGGLSETLVTSTGEASVYFSPDFVAVDNDPHYGLLGGAKACEFEYRVTDLLQPGTNTLVIENRSVADKDYARTMEVADLMLLIKAPPPPPRPRRPAPTGALPTIVPQAKFPKSYRAKQRDAATIEITIGGDVFVVQSRFSSPDGKWNGGSTKFYEHARRIEERNEAIIVFDAFQNLSQDDVPVLQRHTCDLRGRMKQVWLAGISPASNSGSIHDPGNPSVFAITKAAGIGLMTMNDEFQVHVQQSCADGVMGLSDPNFVLKAGGTYTAKWAIVPTATNDFWSLVNAARRVRDANFTLPYQTAFLRTGPKPVGGEVWSDEMLTRYITNKSPHLLCSANDYPRFEGKAPYSTSFQKVDHSVYAKHNQQMKRLVPGLRTVIYYHCFIDNYPGNEERFKADRVLKADGSHVDYGGVYRYDKIFIPTLTNAFGAETAKNIDLILGPCGADGVYWDEMEYSVSEYHYGEPWDGVSGDIDPTTFQLQRRKSSLALLSQDFRAREIKRILARGPLYANGMPYTRTIARLKFQRYTETGSIANCAKTLLYSPVALGDHLTERTEEDAYRWMLAALDYGCVYNWYSDRIIPTHPTLASYMFPITPLELHEGYIIGKERILTKVSGLYGWGDKSKHEVHVFNDKGEEVADYTAPLVTRGSQTWTELRIAEGWSAAIIRKQTAGNR
jgi:hypothetical protein